MDVVICSSKHNMLDIGKNIAHWIANQGLGHRSLKSDLCRANCQVVPTTVHEYGYRFLGTRHAGCLQKHSPLDPQPRSGHPSLKSGLCRTRLRVRFPPQLMDTTVGSSEHNMLDVGENVAHRIASCHWSSPRWLDLCRTRLRGSVSTITHGYDCR